MFGCHWKLYRSGMNQIGSMMALARQGYTLISLSLRAMKYARFIDNRFSKASWRKFHAAVNQNHYIEACVLTDRFSHDDQQVVSLLDQIHDPIDHFTADGAYDETPVYNVVTAHSPKVAVVIPPQRNAVLSDKAASQRNANIIEIAAHGRIIAQKSRQYGRRNLSELAMQRYQKILGDTMHARDFQCQKQEAMIGCGVLNKMTSLGMPSSYRSA